MTALFTTALRGAVCVVLTASATLALPGTPWKRAEVFATCSGRLAALAVRQKAMENPDWTDTLRQRDMFDMLLDATLPAAQANGVPGGEHLRWRSAGWTDTAVLLADMEYSFDRARVARAEAALDTRIADCTTLLLGQ
ncbi:hypothetical protein Ga0609869_000376 [Rhodovulum iodosum]|uniref:Uncharacterized protein n=1 Tax=Rhodovulum iodosum TaxID=68291 RepID=A0ABV3XNY0_9RHOB|nr:hypothetical protein [Rhodovulum robiginosum]RSK37964.1 hypothetical protein EJA01_03295 [Rhodovulum robiginosum]